jgi:aromatic ring-cleaving dioxygenase
MTDTTTELVKIDGYHAHVYYDAETRLRAAQLREEIAATLGVEARELSDEPRDPHRFRSSGLRSRRRSFKTSCRG